jgi:hypothetical protein
VPTLSTNGDGKILVFNGSSGTTQVLIDVSGYFQ